MTGDSNDGAATADGDALIKQMRFSAVAIVVSDMDESIAWYQKVLGLTLVSEGAFDTSYQNRPVRVRLGFLEGLGISVELVTSCHTGRRQRPDPPTHLFSPQPVALILHAPNWAGVMAGLRAHNVDFLWDDLILEGGRGCAIFLDPSNNLIEVIGPSGDYRMDETIPSSLHEHGDRQYPPRVGQIEGNSMPQLIQDKNAID